METNQTAHSQLDAQIMSQAIRLAQKGVYTTTPNPNVGCIILDKSGNTVGQGWHQKAGTPHAEVHALREAGERARGGTAYVTLEPCSHYGRTPPCAEALIKAGVKRVVAAMVDPNPDVSGRGLQMLRDAGIEVSTDVLAAEAAKLNTGFIHRMRTGKPWVTVKLASSLDGKTALENGESKWITGPLARQDVQRHRALSCAILSGSGTVLADDPSLNVRHQELGELSKQYPKSTLRQPLRVLLDGRNQLNGDLRMFDLPGETLVINSARNFALPSHVEQWQAPAKGNKLDLPKVMAYLGERQINDLWVEAGARLAGALLKENLVNELILYQAPKLMGDKAQGLFDLPALQSMDEVIQLAWQDCRQVGDDIKLRAEILTNQNK